MKSVGLNYSTRELCELDISEPRIESDTQVLFRIREVGICGTDRDLASFQLVFPSTDGFLVLGHECVGEVVSTGSHVGAFNPGDSIVPIVRRPCSPPCSWCARGRRDLCSSGTYTERGIVGAHGYFTELAVDEECDLIRIPDLVREHAVLVEPLSVVEKAVGNAFRMHPGQPETALVLGAGTIGLLAAMVLRIRGVDVTVTSLELPNSDRAKLVEAAGAAYRTQPDGQFDIVIEASGAHAAANLAIASLGSAGILVLLGVTPALEVSVLQLILRNQVISGSVNAAPSDFLLAVQDLRAMPVTVLRSMIERVPFSAFQSTLTGPLRAAPKVVHVADSF
jgi:glucose 1-dehydrogenase